MLSMRSIHRDAVDTYVGQDVGKVHHRNTLQYQEQNILHSTKETKYRV
jgi:hypothetical protein